MAQRSLLRPVEGAGRPSNRSEVHSPRTFTKIARGKEIHVSVETFQGHRILDLRNWFRGDDGQMRFGKQGLALKVELLPDLHQAINLMAEAGGVGDTL